MTQTGRAGRREIKRCPHSLYWHGKTVLYGIRGAGYDTKKVLPDVYRISGYERAEKRE